MIEKAQKYVSKGFKSIKMQVAHCFTNLDDLPVIDRARVHLATRSVPAFKECDLEARARQIDAGGQTTCPGADHNGVPGAHATRNLLRIGRVTTRW